MGGRVASSMARSATTGFLFPEDEKPQSYGTRLAAPQEDPPFTPPRWGSGGPPAERCRGPVIPSGRFWRPSAPRSRRTGLARCAQVAGNAPPNCPHP